MPTRRKYHHKANKSQTKISRVNSARKPVETATQKKKRFRNLWTRPLVFCLIYLALTMGAGWSAWTLYPWPLDVSWPTAPILVSVASTETVSSVDAVVGFHNEGDLYQGLRQYQQIAITVLLAEPAASQAPPPDVYIVLPMENLILPGTDSPCVPTCDWQNVIGLGTQPLQTRLHATPVWKDEQDQNGHYSYATLDVNLAATAGRGDDSAMHLTALACTDSECNGYVPTVTVTGSTKLAPEATVHSGFIQPIYSPRIETFRWQPSLANIVIGESPPNFMQGVWFDYPLEHEPSNRFSTRYPVSAFSESAREADSNRLFIAGGLVGLAGGFIVATIQEGLALLFSMRKRK